MIAVLPYVTHPKTAVLGRAGGGHFKYVDWLYLEASMVSVYAVGNISCVANS